MNALRSIASAIARRRSGLSKGGSSRLTIRLVLTLFGRSSQIACGAWLLMSFSSGIVTLIGPGQVELAGDKAEDRRRAVGDDRVFDAVEIGPALLPVIRVAHELDQFIRLEFDEFERAGADRMLRISPASTWQG